MMLSRVERRFSGLLLAFTLCVGCALVGCGPSAVDGSSKESMEKSLKAISERMDDAEREEFAASLLVVGLSNAFSGDIEGKMLSELDGKTPEQINEMAERLRVEAQEREQVRVEAEKKRQMDEMRAQYQALIQKKQSAELSKATLARFQIAQPRLVPPDRGDFLRQNQVSLHVWNQTGAPISRAEFRYKYITPGRSIPWSEGDLLSIFSGGIEHGEKVFLDYCMVSSGGLEYQEYKQDAVLMVEVIKLEGPSGKVVAEADWTNENEAQLERIKKMIGPTTP